MEIKKPVENVLEETLKNLKNIIDVNSIVGEPIVQGTTTIIPISKVSVGYVGGGGEYNNKKKKKYDINYPFAGGSGGGCNITPIGFLIIDKSKIQFIRAMGDNSIEKTIDVVSDFIKSMK